MVNLICAVHEVSDLTKEGVDTSGDDCYLYLSLFTCRSLINSTIKSFATGCDLRVNEELGKKEDCQKVKQLHYLIICNATSPLKIVGL